MSAAWRRSVPCACRATAPADPVETENSDVRGKQVTDSHAAGKKGLWRGSVTPATAPVAQSEPRARREKGLAPARESRSPASAAGPRRESRTRGRGRPRSPHTRPRSGLPECGGWVGGRWRCRPPVSDLGSRAERAGGPVSSPPRGPSLQRGVQCAQPHSNEHPSGRRQLPRAVSASSCDATATTYHTLLRGVSAGWAQAGGMRADEGVAASVVVVRFGSCLPHPGDCCAPARVCLRPGETRCTHAPEKRETV